VERTARQAFAMRPWYLGNFTRESGAAPRQKSRAFAVWSGIKAKLAPAGASLVSLLVIGNLLAAAAVWARRGTHRDTRAAAFCLAALATMAGTELVVCALADSIDDAGRHLLAFNAMFDLLLIADAVCLTALAARVRLSRSGAAARELPTAG
jgi:hypothetical protein